MSNKKDLSNDRVHSINFDPRKKALDQLLLNCRLGDKGEPQLGFHRSLDRRGASHLHPLTDLFETSPLPPKHFFRAHPGPRSLLSKDPRYIKDFFKTECSLPGVEIPWPDDDDLVGFEEFITEGGVNQFCAGHPKFDIPL